MPTPNSLRTELENFLDLLFEAEIALYTTPVVIEHRHRRGQRITWGNSSSNGELFRGDFATVAEYKAWLEDGVFSALLFDGALLQLSFDLKGETIVGHRLAYYPCPYNLDLDLARSEPLLDVIDLYANEMPRLRTPLRFDYDPDASKPGHPASHLTLSSHDCRWAIRGPLSLGHFIQFVFRHFYVELWQVHPFLRDWPVYSAGACIEDEETKWLYIEVPKPTRSEEW